MPFWFSADYIIFIMACSTKVMQSRLLLQIKSENEDVGLVQKGVYTHLRQ